MVIKRDLYLNKLQSGHVTPQINYVIAMTKSFELLIFLAVYKSLLMDMPPTIIKSTNEKVTHYPYFKLIFSFKNTILYCLNPPDKA